MVQCVLLPYLLSLTAVLQYIMNLLSTWNHDPLLIALYVSLSEVFCIGVVEAADSLNPGQCLFTAVIASSFALFAAMVPISRDLFRTWLSDDGLFLSRACDSNPLRVLEPFSITTRSTISEIILAQVASALTDSTEWGSCVEFCTASGAHFFAVPVEPGLERTRSPSHWGHCRLLEMTALYWLHQIVIPPNNYSFTCVDMGSATWILKGGKTKKDMENIQNCLLFLRWL